MTAPGCGPLAAGLSHWGQLGERQEVGMGTGVSVVLRPALGSSSRLLGLLPPVLLL